MTMRNIGKWTLRGFRLQIGERREITWRGWGDPISKKKPIQIGRSTLHSFGPFAIFLKGNY